MVSRRPRSYDTLTPRQLWTVVVRYGLLGVIGAVILEEQRPGLVAASLAAVGWLVLTRRADGALRWFPLMYIYGGVLGVFSPFSDMSVAQQIGFGATTALWVAFLSAVTVWLVRRF